MLAVWAEKEEEQEKEEQQQKNEKQDKKKKTKNKTDAGCLTFIVGHLDLAGRPQARPSHGPALDAGTGANYSHWVAEDPHGEKACQSSCLSLPQSLKEASAGVHVRRSFWRRPRMRQAATPATLPMLTV